VSWDNISIPRRPSGTYRRCSSRWRGVSLRGGCTLCSGLHEIFGGLVLRPINAGQWIRRLSGATCGSHQNFHAPLWSIHGMGRLYRRRYRMADDTPERLSGDLVVCRDCPNSPSARSRERPLQNLYRHDHQRYLEAVSATAKVRGEKIHGASSPCGNVTRKQISRYGRIVNIARESQAWSTRRGRDVSPLER